MWNHVTESKAIIDKTVRRGGGIRLPPAAPARPRRWIWLEADADLGVESRVTFEAWRATAVRAAIVVPKKPFFDSSSYERVRKIEQDNNNIFLSFFL